MKNTLPDAWMCIKSKQRTGTILCLLLSAVLSLGLIGCGGPGSGGAAGSSEQETAELGWQEQYDLGMRYLSEGNYEEAILAFEIALSIEPRAIEIYEALGNAYFESGQPESAVPYFEYVYAAAPSGDAASRLLLGEVASRDMDAAERTAEDVRMGGELLDSYFSDVLNYIFEHDDVELAEELAEFLEEIDEAEATRLCLRVWPLCREGDNEAVNELLADEYQDIPRPPHGDTVYAGAVDENGDADGYGMCIYGDGLCENTVMYIGNWEHGKRSGEGTAYSGGEDYITCTWENDLPNGEMVLRRSYGGGQITYGTLVNGHVSGPTHSYTLAGEWARDDCMEDGSWPTGYAYVSVDNPNGGECPCVGNHRFCWDCQEKEGI